MNIEELQKQYKQYCEQKSTPGYRYGYYAGHVWEFLEQLEEENLSKKSNNNKPEINIKLFKERHQMDKEIYYGAEIFLNGDWFKEISGLPNINDVLLGIAVNEDLLTEINTLQNESSMD